MEYAPPPGFLNVHKIEQFLYVYIDISGSNKYQPMLIACSSNLLVYALQWRHNGHDGVSNHQPHDC